MKLFNCNVRLGGNLLHSVPKIGITEKELYLLRAIHGDDSIDNPRPAGEADIDERDHLFELARAYGRPLVEKTFQTVLTNFDEEDAREERAQERKANEASRKNAAAAAAAAADAAAQASNGENETKQEKTVTLE
jgi:hypothetical protein